MNGSRIFLQENTLNSTTGKLSAPKPKKRDPRTEVFDRLKVFNGVQVMATQL